MRRLPALLLAGLLLCSLPTYAALGADMLPTVQRTTSHRYLIRGEYDREETLDTAVISAERVELENKAITGDLTIDSMVGEGPVDLKNVSIGGTLYIYGGGEITLNGVTAAQMVVDSPDTEVELTIRGKSEIALAQVKTDLSITENMLSSGYGGLKALEVPADTTCTLLPLTFTHCRLDSMTVHSPTEISGTGSCKITQLTANRTTSLSGVEVVESTGSVTGNDDN